MKSILFSLILFSSLAQANICEQKKMGLVGGTDFYKNFIFSSGQLKQDYTFFYQKVDDALEAHIQRNCQSGQSKGSDALEREHAQLCYQSCEIEAAKFHDLIGTKVFKKAKVRTMAQECQSICAMNFNCEENILCREGL